MTEPDSKVIQTGILLPAPGVIVIRARSFFFSAPVNTRLTSTS